MKTKSGPAAIASFAMRAKRLVEKASNIFGRFPKGRMEQQRKIDRQNRINENRLNEEVEVRRFVDENLENELRELAKIDSWYIEIDLKE